MKKYFVYSILALAAAITAPPVYAYLSPPAASSVTISDTAYNATTWNANTDGATKNAIRDELELKAPIASPTFTGTVAGITSTMVGLGNVSNTSDATKNAASVALTNKDLSSATNTFPAGHVLQVVNTIVTGGSTGTTALPIDDSIPQNNEGDEFMSLAVTPKSATSKLLIQVVAIVGHSSGSTTGMALFQDSTAAALAAVDCSITSTNLTQTIPLNFYMTSGTTSATTFKIRIGSNTGSTTQFNRSSGARVFGGVASSSITITEIAQ